MPECQIPSFEDALLKCKQAVYLHRIRLKPFFLDHDKLRTGRVFEGQFLSALSQAGLHTLLSAQLLTALTQRYLTVDFEGQKGHKLCKVDYEKFLADVEIVFGEKKLEKTPQKEVEAEPTYLLDRLRYQRATRLLEPRKEARVQELLDRLRVDCKIMGIQLKHAFDDAAHAPKLPKVVNHVTTSQFYQGLAKLNLGVSASDAALLAEKYAHAEHGDLVNYPLFSTCVAGGLCVQGSKIDSDCASPLSRTLASGLPAA